MLPGKYSNKLKIGAFDNSKVIFQCLIVVCITLEQEFEKPEAK